MAADGSVLGEAVASRGALPRVTLSELRERFADLTQAQVAERLVSSQGRVSRLERRDDLRISQLMLYIDALGGRVDIVAELPGRGAFELTQFGAAVDPDCIDW
jgi:transcriptional regulator with XRE-family HTH domain